MSKKCCVCHETKPETDFSKDRSKKDGLQSKCKLCSYAWKKANRNKCLKYAAKHKDKVDPNRRERALKRAEEAERKKVQRRLKVERRKELNKTKKFCRTCEQWLDRETYWTRDIDNSDGLARRCTICRREYYIKKRGKARGWQETFTAKNVWETYNKFNWECFNCKAKDKLTIDHNDCEKILSKNNAVLLCKACNTKKHNKNFKEFYSDDKLKSLNEFISI